MKYYTEAIVDYNRAVKINPNNAMAYHNRGILKKILQNYDEAIIDFNKAIKIDPFSAKAYNSRGNVKAELKRYEEAIADYNRAVKINPNDAAAYNGRGNVKTELKRYEEAIIDYNSAIKNNPNLADAYNGRGTARAGLKHYYEAITDFTEAIKKNDKYAQAHNNLGIVKRILEEEEEALKHFKDASDIDPTIVTKESPELKKIASKLEKVHSDVGEYQNFREIFENQHKEFKKEERNWFWTALVVVIAVFGIIAYLIMDILSAEGEIGTEIERNIPLFLLLYPTIISFLVIRQYTNAKENRIDAQNRLAMSEAYMHIKNAGSGEFSDKDKSRFIEDISPAMFYRISSRGSGMPRHWSEFPMGNKISGK